MTEHTEAVIKDWNRRLTKCGFEVRPSPHDGVRSLWVYAIGSDVPAFYCHSAEQFDGIVRALEVASGHTS